MFAVRIVFCAALLALPGVSCAADSYMVGPAPEAAVIAEGGIPCSAGAPFWSPPKATATELPWPFVWLGHFSGGRPYKDASGLTLVEWLDKKVCFPSRRACSAWVSDLRCAYHRPEGYWTCLLIR